MNLLLIYAHYNPKNRIAGYVFHTLEHFLALNFNVVFATNSHVPERYLTKLTAKGIRVIITDNIGYDFYAWKTAILDPSVELEKYDRLVLMNCSVYGPFFNLKNFMANLESRNSDVIGATLSFELQKHIQSYFFYFKKTAIESIAFKEYWDNFIPYTDRQDTIFMHELGISEYLESGGLKLDAYYINEDSLNPSLAYPERLYKAKLPFFKFTKISKQRHLLVLIKLFIRNIQNSRWKLN